MWLEKLSTDSPEQIDKSSLKELHQMKGKFFEVSDKMRARENDIRKIIQFGWNEYHDSPDTIYIPFDSDLRVATEYNQKFKWIDVSLLWVIKPNRQKNGSVSFQIFESWNNGKLSKENMLLDSTISNHWSSLEDKVSIDIKKDGLEVKKSKSLIEKTNDYLSRYFGYEEEEKAQERVNEIQFKEMKSVLEEGDPEELLEQMDWSVWL